MDIPQLTLVLGGAASGKSRHGETMIMGTERPRYYVATAQAWDDEMRNKIADHLAQRGENWTTIEAPMNAASALGDIPSGGIVLFDCATMWLTNQILSDADVTAAQVTLISALLACASPVVIVSNEVGAGIVPDNALSRQFRNAQGKLNQDLAAHADVAVAVMAGLALPLKGAWPE